MEFTVLKVIDGILISDCSIIQVTCLLINRTTIFCSIIRYHMQSDGNRRTPTILFSCRHLASNPLVCKRDHKCPPSVKSSYALKQFASLAISIYVA